MFEDLMDEEVSGELKVSACLSSNSLQVKFLAEESGPPLIFGSLMREKITLLPKRKIEIFRIQFFEKFVGC
jgi:hypothetical protein